MVMGLLALIVVAMAGSGCGSAGGPAGGPVSDPVYLGAYHQLEDCVNVHRPVPQLEWGDTIPCPQSRQMCCLASVGYSSCRSVGLEADGQCGARGVYWSETHTVELPRDCDQGAATLLALWRHEAGHHLGLDHGDPRAGRCGA